MIVDILDRHESRQVGENQPEAPRLSPLRPATSSQSATISAG